MIEGKIGGHIWFMHARPHRRQDLFDLADQGRNISGSKGPRGTGGNGDISEANFYTLNQFQIGRFYLASHMSIPGSLILTFQGEESIILIRFRYFDPAYGNKTFWRQTFQRQTFR